MTKRKVGAIIQARMSSRRFPGKVMHGLEGKPILEYVLERVSKCARLDSVTVATSTDSSDDAIAAYCRYSRIPCYRGSLTDVAARFIGAIDAFGFDAFVRVNADSPFIDQCLLEKGVGIFASGNFDIVTNVQKRTFPRGQSVEVVNSLLFKKSYPQMSKPEEHEHITSYFYAHPEGLTINNFTSETDFSDLRLCVDTPDDFDRYARIVAKFDRPHWEYGFEELASLLRQGASK